MAPQVVEFVDTRHRKSPVSENLMITSEEVLRRLTIGDPAYCRALMAAVPDVALSALDARGKALVRLGGSITAGSIGPMLRQRVADALDAGLSFDEVVAAMISLAPTVGIERIVASAPDLALALGYDVDGALEQLDDRRTSTKA